MKNSVQKRRTATEICICLWMRGSRPRLCPWIIETCHGINWFQFQKNTRARARAPASRRLKCSHDERERFQKKKRKKREKGRGKENNCERRARKGRKKGRDREINGNAKCEIRAMKRLLLFSSARGTSASTAEGCLLEIVKSARDFSLAELLWLAPRSRQTKRISF